MEKGKIYLLEITVPKPERFNSRSFGTYTHPQTQKTVYLKNANGQALIGGFTASRLVMTFNTSKPYEANVVMFLMNHPDRGTVFTLKNTEEEKEKGNELLLRQIDVEGQVYNMDLKRLKTICASLGYTYDDEKPYLLAKIVRKIRQEDKEKEIYGVDEVISILKSKSTEIVFDIKEMLKHKIIVKKQSGVYVYGEFSLGLNLDQIALYMQENQDVYAGIKKDLRMSLKDSSQSNGELLDIK